MLWDAWQNADTLRYTKELIAFRRAHPALIYGEVVTRLLDESRGIWLAERSHAEDRVWIGVNVGKKAVRFSLKDGDGVELQPMECRLWAV